MYLSLEEAGLICGTEEWKQKQEEECDQQIFREDIKEDCNA